MKIRRIASGSLRRPSHAGCPTTYTGRPGRAAGGVRRHGQRRRQLPPARRGGDPQQRHVRLPVDAEDLHHLVRRPGDARWRAELAGQVQRRAEPRPERPPPRGVVPGELQRDVAVGHHHVRADQERRAHPVEADVPGHLDPPHPRQGLPDRGPLPVQHRPVALLRREVAVLHEDRGAAFQQDDRLHPERLVVTDLVVAALRQLLQPARPRLQHPGPLLRGEPADLLAGGLVGGRFVRRLRHLPRQLLPHPVGDGPQVGEDLLGAGRDR
ncbi:hypothetical protein [Streptomyces sudanensis]|uniref:hypothetical protein n=1 Tax=Streptomyces sudanensis TaxID=436397 RepID=UPI0027E5509D|nr:hypothetical protein [Streptomyces sudanensis]